MQNEIWKDIPYYEGKYQVSNMGNVRNLDFHRTGRVQILKPGKNKGYLRVQLWKDGKCRTAEVHRLVAQVFLENPNNLPQVNHINEIKTDNRLENLEWCDCKYNINYGSHNQRVAETLKGVYQSEESKRKISIPVAQCTREGELIAVFYGAKEAERQTGIYSSNIIKCCKGKLKSAGNYKWKYVNQ